MILLAKQLRGCADELEKASIGEGMAAVVQLDSMEN
jgi:hypothetical protein